MSITLSSHDIANLREPSRLLASPLDHPDADKVTIVAVDGEDLFTLVFGR